MSSVSLGGWLGIKLLSEDDSDLNKKPKAVVEKSRLAFSDNDK